MVQTRSMSKTDTKTATDTKIVVNDKVVERASKQTRKKARKNANKEKGDLKRLDLEAMWIFMADYLIQHEHEVDFAGMEKFRQMSDLDKTPFLKAMDMFEDPVDFAGQEEWRQMSALEKAPFIKTAMERRERIREMWAKPKH